MTAAKHTPTPCDHPKLLARDFANQPRLFGGPCLLCQRDALVAALEEFLQFERGGSGELSHVTRARELVVSMKAAP